MRVGTKTPETLEHESGGLLYRTSLRLRICATNDKAKIFLVAFPRYVCRYFVALRGITDVITYGSRLGAVSWLVKGK